MTSVIRVTAPVRQALDSGQPVVALESSVLAQGLPIPENHEAATRMVGAVERAGATAAITAVVRGKPTVGLEPDELERFLQRDGVRKVSARDIAPAMARGLHGATTVAATLALASQVGVEVFATGGIGGVHRDAPFDESADLLELSRTPMIVVCAGAKSILDLPATWERLETLGVPVVGFCTGELPGFFTAETGIALNSRADDLGEIAELWRAHRSLGRTQSLLVVQPPPAEYALPRDDVEAAVASAREDARREGIRGAHVTPYLLAAVTRLTGGSSLAANLALLERNASLAGDIARVCTEKKVGHGTPGRGASRRRGRP
jgi:pseudouridine-5'-phosphate glycosidase